MLAAGIGGRGQDNKGAWQGGLHRRQHGRKAWRAKFNASMSQTQRVIWHRPRVHIRLLQATACTGTKGKACRCGWLTQVTPTLRLTEQQPPHPLEAFAQRWEGSTVEPKSSSLAASPPPQQAAGEGRFPRLQDRTVELTCGGVLGRTETGRAQAPVSLVGWEWGIGQTVV